MSALEERRQRARDAFQDASGLGDNGWHANEQAIETATRVRITPEIIKAGLFAAGAGRDDPARYVNAIAASFVAAGFEVEA